MDLFPLLVGLLVAGTVLCVVFYFQAGGSRVRQRLLEGSKSALVRTEVEKHYFPAPLVNRLEEFLGLKRDSARMKELKKTLAQAGYNSDRALSIVMGFKLGLPLVLPILASHYLFSQNLSRLHLLAAFYILFTSGYFLPNLVLNHLVEARKKKIKEELPDSLDLMVVCVEAGQGLNAAMKRVAEELILSHPIIAQELLMVNLEINAGMEREQALRSPRLRKA